MGSRQPRRYADLSKPRTHWNLRVELPEDGMRLDRFLTKRMRWKSRTEVQTLIDDGVVSVNDTQRKASTRLHTLDHIVVVIPEPEEDFDPASIPVTLLYEDDYLVAVNKQPGIVVHPTSGHTLNNVLSALHARYRDTANPAKDRVPHICHRIDRETSGVLLFAFSEKLKAHVSRQFEARSVAKQYLALVHGAMPRADGEIDAPILHRRDGWPRLIVHADGLESRTRWHVEEEFARAALVRFFPRTGRTHQIRVHASHAGHPLLCDETYGGTRPIRPSDLGLPSPQGAVPLLERVALHSAHLEIVHPETGEQLILEAPLPADLGCVVEALRANADPR